MPADWALKASSASNAISLIVRQRTSDNPQDQVQSARHKEPPPESRFADSMGQAARPSETMVQAGNASVAASKATEDSWSNTASSILKTVGIFGASVVGIIGAATDR